MEWLQTLGPVIVEFSIPRFSVTHQNAKFTLQGDPKLLPTPTTYNQLCHLHHNDFIASLHLITFHSVDHQRSPNLPNHSITHPNSSLHSLPAFIHDIIVTHASIFNNFVDYRQPDPMITTCHSF